MAHGMHCPLTWAFVCRYRDLALYLMPSMALAAIIRFLSVRYPVFFLFRLAGTMCHELAHLSIGWLTGASPQSFSIIPRHMGSHWQLGAVAFSNIRWYNAAPAALAPLLVIAIPVWVAWWRTHGIWKFDGLDIALAFILAPQFLSFWPSGADWKIAGRSWPYLIVLGIAWWIYVRFYGLR